MSNINGIGQTRGINPIQAPKPTAKSEATTSTSSANRTDKVELSNVNALLTKLKTNDVRTDMVADIKAQIEAGTYETDEKLNGAIDKLMDDLA
jgi:anti-sigma28 factor (negative regulator of flagellin synthesis)